MYSTFDFYLKVNNLLITRVYNGAGDTVENVAFGYGALTGSAVPDATVSGSTDGAVSGVADGRVVIALKGDYNGDGNVTSGDNGAFTLAVNDATDNQFATYFGDFNGNNTVTSGDIGSTPGAFPPVGSFYQGAVSRSTSCP